MKIEAAHQAGKFLARTTALILAVALAGCGRPAEKTSAAKFVGTEPLAFALAPQVGDSASDRSIRHFQDEVRRGGRTRSASLERLGWAFIAKARETFDSGYYELAGTCALALEAESPGCAEGLLLRGHVLQNLHRFQEAEPLARQLVAKRGISFDYALLGDTLMEQGRLNDAVPAYQKAMDLKPDLHSYARAAHIRWLLGDVNGAIELMQAAVGASSPQDPVSVAWTCTRLATFDFQTGDTRLATDACAAAVASMPDYPPALLLRGKMSLAAGDAQAAIPPLELAAARNPTPEFQWTLADALRAGGRSADAEKVEAKLRARGAAADPRTLSLFLATRGEDTDQAIALAQSELKQRQDVFTHDALAWALAAAGRMPEATREMEQALAAGTEDGRLYFHAAAIAFRSGRMEEAQQWIAAATELKQTLLPSERTQLQQLESRAVSTRPIPPFPASHEAEKTNPKQTKQS